MSTTQWEVVDSTDRDYTVSISAEARKRLSDEELRKAAAENARRIQSSCIYEISAGVGLGGFVVAIVWMLVTHTGG
jgi:hypothetical protein